MKVVGLVLEFLNLYLSTTIALVDLKIHKKQAALLLLAECGACGFGLHDGLGPSGTFHVNIFMFV
jgi:hypothetical protein